jgi:hypothetical protein
MPDPGGNVCNGLCNKTYLEVDEEGRWSIDDW